MAGSAMQTEELLMRVRAEFLEMPGLGLTPDQARRLLNLDRSLCDALLTALVDMNFLRRTSDGRYIRCDYER
jgi:hypothetical protein